MRAHAHTSSQWPAREPAARARVHKREHAHTDTHAHAYRNRPGTQPPSRVMRKHACAYPCTHARTHRGIHHIQPHA
eukprot:15435504-Alexandrium_andersonii.AAC.1